MVKSQIYFNLCCIFCSVAQALVVNECSQGGLVPEEVIVDDCEPDAAVCPVKFNGLFNMTMKFKAPHYLESIKSKMIVKTAFGNIEPKGESVSNDVCAGILNTFCPLVEKESIEYRYSTKLVVPLFIPVTLEFRILDTVLNETVVCFILDVSPSKL
ncbi:uncharacterized protein LOC108909375 [Anoplophora glabripennis]|uniref:uncharacterized protein LOC108909375 n=1 Tax=Anoplophora glabripennis TaxID=217634 RepID=UPI000874FF95|nr:uncharacterized protein LOC108909375 [Anoplophora glabripennis]